MARRVSFLITAKNEGFIKALDQSGRRLRRFGYKMERMGRSLTRNITLPVAAAGGAAVKMASDFESSLSQAQAQANLTAEQVSFIGDAAKETAKRTGESTDDIIEAYKFTISAGMSLAESQEIVGSAAEAAAAGFGEQRDLVRLTTTAMQAYSKEIDSGRQFMDMLVGSAQVMELEVSKLGPAMQRNVGVAKELDIELEQLLAGIGSVSEIMGDAQRGGRMFQTMLSKLLKPSAAGEAAIAGVFGSLENLHRSIREEGLLQTMVELRKRLEEAGGGFEDVFTGQRGLEAALNFTNREGERTIEIMRNMGDTAGSTKSAFDSVSETTERRFKRALQNLKVAAIELGQTLLPIVNDIIDSVSEWVTWFSELDKATQQNIIRIAGFAAAMGPLLIVGGKVVKMLGSLIKGVSGLATAIKVGTAAVWGYVAAFVALGVASFKANQRSQDRIDAISEEVDQIGTLGEANQKIVEIERKRTRLQRQMAKGARGLGKSLEDLNQQLEETIDRRNDLASQQLQLEDPDTELDKIVSRTKKNRDTSEETGGDIGGEFEFDFTFATPIDKITEFEDKVRNLDNIYGKSIDSMKASGAQFASVTEAAGIKASSAWTNFVQKSKDAGFDFVNFLSGQVGSAITSFATNLGQMFVGAGDEFQTGLEKIILVVVDFAKQLGQLLIGIGSALQFIPGFGQASGTPYLIAGAALVALASGASAVIQKNTAERRERAQSVSDALVRSDGSVVRLHPNDDILAMQDFGNLQPAMSGSQVIKNEMFLDGQTVWSNQRRVNTNKRR